MKRSTKKKTIRIVSYILLGVISFVIAFPFIWLVLTSFKTYQEIYSYPIMYLPKSWTTEHYHKISNLDFKNYFFNSIIVGTGTMIFSLLIGLFPAYAFSRYSFKWKNTLLISVLIFQMFPMIVFLVPIFKFLDWIKLLDTHIGLILAYIPFTTPITIVFLRSFFLSVPKSLEEAALIDGCTRTKAFLRIIFPVTLPGIAAVGVYAFLFAWSELLYSMSLLTSKALQTIPTFLSVFVGQYQTRWGPLFAGSVFATLPPLVVFILLQRYFISGLVSGAVKE
ncbi:MULTISPECIES: carbohydrate ABC transporter permease [Pseudothermotoga]|jgi:multiple sugar transport system permease protein|uniref:Binding-protein-dependent transport systems inner membrane component n=1 Tax=Pseudothermotoga lettingae (strain ATCC BAA-301 / DSM 14385 / NBRC 107922 / TMO) TaxID=416591 RepID=A8F7X7_PSELT|nr:MULTISPECIES: carbohydrate ABC transporter permease [Pseudothermotoga]ABV34261.1 binding-protein-dependent transport systems inner membrane component [Pseudothermotoga lettingae TMO]KUK21310.1 MAG: Binding-protein-dependent transport systems inner membrane component [Pseudothermotoga lettingae]MDI3494953.1 multiple sugar transport system permease protein [Pseudothermotoga sp.]MDK2884867.1 multiple sugar transport system permease protein [Pseudothermotoga sp.]HBJ80595.1 carbohydrate ABC tran